MSKTLRGAMLAAAILASGPALAQSNPSADQILDQLKPTAQSLKGATRGIRPVAPAPALPSDAAPAVASFSRARPSAERAASYQRPTAAHASAPSVNLQIEFRSGSADLAPAATRSLDELGKALSNPQLAAYRFKIEGHTDTVGSPESNKALSDQRAKAVSSYLSTRFGVDEARLEAAGVGEEDLAVPTGPQVPEPRNRRVQVINLGA